jgi:DNA-damage-inducible protein J
VAVGLAFIMQLHYNGGEGALPMAANALIQTRIDSAVKARASAVLETMGLTVSDAVRILLTRTAHEGALPFELTANREAYDAWFRAKVREALEDDRPDIAHEEVEAEFAARRAATLRKAGDA